MDAVFAETLARGEEVLVVGFGVFGVKTHPDRTWRNPGTGGWMQIAASSAPTFRACKPLRDAARAQGSLQAGHRNPARQSKRERRPDSLRPYRTRR